MSTFSLRFGRPNVMTVLMAPIQALVAAFSPAQSLPAYSRYSSNPAAARRQDTVLHPPTQPVKVRQAPARSNAAVRQLKIVRQFEPGANRSSAGRLVISGRMADVCAELERLAGDRP